MKEDGSPDPLRDGSPAAFDELIESIGPASLLVVIESRMGRLLRERMSSEDVLQEVLLRAWRDRAKCEWRGRKHFRSWLLTLVDHRLATLAANETALKRGGGTTPLALPGGDSDSGDGLAAPEPIASTTPSRIALYKEQSAAIREALEGLPDELREVVRLRLFEQIPIEDVASRLSINGPTVRYRFAKGAELYEKRLAAALASRSSDAARNSRAIAPPDPAPD